MQLSLEQVKEKFSRYSGEDPLDDGERGALCRQLCRECFDRAQALAGDPEETDEAAAAVLESWAAAEAFYQLALRDGAAAPERVTADGVRLSARDAVSRAKALAEEKRREAAPVLGEEAFYFGSI